MYREAMAGLAAYTAATAQGISTSFSHASVSRASGRELSAWRGRAASPDARGSGPPQNKNKDTGARDCGGEERGGTAQVEDLARMDAGFTGELAVGSELAVRRELARELAGGELPEGGGGVAPVGRLASGSTLGGGSDVSRDSLDSISLPRLPEATPLPAWNGPRAREQNEPKRDQHQHKAGQGADGPAVGGGADGLSAQVAAPEEVELSDTEPHERGAPGGRGMTDTEPQEVAFSTAQSTAEVSNDGFNARARMHACMHACTHARTHARTHMNIRTHTHAFRMQEGRCSTAAARAECPPQRSSMSARNAGTGVRTARKLRSRIGVWNAVSPCESCLSCCTHARTHARILRPRFRRTQRQTDRQTNRQTNRQTDR